MTYRTFAFGVAIIAIVGFAGCTRPKPMGTVSGKVTVAGKPVTIGQVQFFNESTGAGCSAALNDAGEYAMPDPIPAGTYSVAVNPPRAPSPIPEPGAPPPPMKPPYIVPHKYQNVATSGQQFEVKEGNSNVFNIDFPAK